MAQTVGFKRFGDCPVHGEAREDIFQASLDDGRAAWLCRACASEKRTRADGQPSYVKVEALNVRSIRLVRRGGFGDLPKPCGGACTSGKRSCDCRCGGRCHGAGKCLGGHA